MEHKEHKEEHTEESSLNNFFSDPWKAGLLVVIVLLLLYIATEPGGIRITNNGNGTTNNQTGNQTVSGRNLTSAKATINLFVMSHCPYGVQAEQIVKPVLDEFNGDVNLSLHFIASQNASGSFLSMHGPDEVAEDLRQVCIMKYYPDKFLDYLSCVDQDYTNADAWKVCVSQMDANVISKCANGEEGNKLLVSNVNLTNQLGIQSSPTIYINEQAYDGGRDNSSITRALCGVTPDSSPCKNLPPEVSVGLTIVTDNKCTVCDTSQAEAALRGGYGISKLVVNKVDYQSNEGKALVQQYNITGVPFYIFNSSIANHPSYSNLANYMQKVGSSYVIAVQPVEMINTVEMNDTIQLFVMSLCPYGNIAERAMNETLYAMPGLEFSGLHFIASQNPDGSFSSLHGDNEVAEDLRQVCIMKYYNTSKLFEYLMCISANYSNAGSIWQSCAGNSSIDTAKITNCSTSDEGKNLLKDNIKLSNDLVIQSSPTMLLNNRTIFSTIYADDIRQAVCSYDATLTGCNKTLSGAGSGGSAPTGGCG